jgi:hypothetical protein
MAKEWNSKQWFEEAQLDELAAAQSMMEDLIEEEMEPTPEMLKVFLSSKNELPRLLVEVEDGPQNPLHLRYQEAASRQQIILSGQPRRTAKASEWERQAWRRSSSNQLQGTQRGVGCTCCAPSFEATPSVSFSFSA